MIGPEQNRSAPSNPDSHCSRSTIPHPNKMPDATFVMPLFCATVKAMNEHTVQLCIHMQRLRQDYDLLC